MVGGTGRLWKCFSKALNIERSQKGTWEHLLHPLSVAIVFDMHFCFSQKDAYRMGRQYALLSKNSQ